jgi:hypothetical protein
MKKSIQILLAAIALASVTWGTSYAQSATNSLQAGSTNEDGIVIKSNNGVSGVVNEKAERNFKKDYYKASGVEWSTLQDNSLMCRFSINNIPYRAFYTPQGQWKYTVSSYDAGKLDKRIYDNIKSVYYNSSIVFVNQIDRVNGGPVYIVEIQDEKSIKKLRVDDEGMGIVEELVKQ